jgi:hypothetical protein
VLGAKRYEMTEVIGRKWKTISKNIQTLPLPMAYAQNV